jgi:NDP-sugar pyrophosphorylase family protein
VTSRSDDDRTGRSCKALLLAGGVGSRLRPLTNTIPKCLVPIDGKPLLDYWLDALERAGIREALINTHHLPEPVREHIAEANETRALLLEESFEPVLLGSAGTVHANRSWMDDADDCLIVYVDNLSNVDVTEVVDFHRGHDDPFTMMLFHTPYPSQCGIADLDEAGRIVSFVEKPKEPPSDLANGGLYVVTAEAYREMADQDAFDLGFDVLPKFVGRMRGWVFDGYHRDIGTLEALEQAREDAPRVFGGEE